MLSSHCAVARTELRAAARRAVSIGSSVPPPAVRRRGRSGGRTGPAGPPGPSSSPAARRAPRRRRAARPTRVAWAVRPSCWRATTSRPATNAATASAGPVTVRPLRAQRVRVGDRQHRAAVEHDDVLEQPLDLADQVARQDDRARVLEPVGEQGVVERVPRRARPCRGAPRRAASAACGSRCRRRRRTPTACRATARSGRSAGRARSGRCSASASSRSKSGRRSPRNSRVVLELLVGRAARRRSPGPGTCRPARARSPTGPRRRRAPCPTVLRRNAASTDSAVVLPEPLRPSSPVITPGRMVNDTASSAIVDVVAGGEVPDLDAEAAHRGPSFLAEPVDDLVDADAEHARLLEHRVDDVGEERGPALGEQLLAGALGDEHPDAAALVEDALVDQLGERLGGGRGVDPERRRVLRRRHDLLLRLERARQHVRRIWSAICTYRGSRPSNIARLRSVVHYLTN